LGGRRGRRPRYRLEKKKGPLEGVNSKRVVEITIFVGGGYRKGEEKE